jgi:hypothetical protein
MSIESSLLSLLKAIPAVAGGAVARVYPNVTPDNPTFPLIVYQVVGGQAIDFMDRTLPESENYRVQVSCWAKSADDVRALSLAVRKLIIEDGDQFESAQTLGQAVNDYQDAQKICGTRQDFSIWIKAR